MQAIRIHTLITVLFSGAATAADSAQATPAVSLTGEKAVAQLKESGQYDSLAAPPSGPPMSFLNGIHPQNNFLGN